MFFTETKKNLLELDYYTGCFHGCQHCPNCPKKDKAGYPTKEWLQPSPVELPIETLLKNIKTELSDYSTKNKIFLGKKSDPYQPIERYYEITKTITEHLLNNNYHLTIETKSSDILRDVEMLERFQKKIQITISIPSLEAKEVKEKQPQASTIHERLFALKTIHYLEIPHNIKISPVLPETNPVGIIKKLKLLNQRFIIAKPLGIEIANWKRTKNKIKKISGIQAVFE